MKPLYSFKIGSFTVEIVKTGGIEKALGRIFMLTVAILLIAAMSGCSTLAQIGEIEGSGKAGEYLRAIESSRVVLGGKPSNRDVASVVNRTMGETRALEESLDSTNFANLPTRIERLGYILENTTSEISQ